MSAVRTFAQGLLVFIGASLLLCAFLSGIAALSSLAERMRHGSGPMFADVEFFGLAAAVLCATGGMALWLGLRMKVGNRNTESGESECIRKS